MIKAILMDFNGVIIDDEPIQMQAYHDVLKDDGIDLSEEDYLACLGMDEAAFMINTYKRKGKTIDEARMNELIAAKSAAWRARVSDQVPLFDGVPNFVEKMSREFALGIVSMAPRGEIDFILEKTGLTGYFSAIISAEDVSNCKPHPECFRIGFAKLDAARVARGRRPMTHSECLAIEDSPPGIMAARAADLPALGVANTVSADALRAAGAVAVAARLDDWMPDSIRRVFV